MVDLKAVRKEKGLTGETVCRKAGVSPSGLSMIESGKRRPSVDLAKRIADVLGFSWTQFYEDSPDVINKEMGAPTETANESCDGVLDA